MTNKFEIIFSTSLHIISFCSFTLDSMIDYNYRWTARNSYFTFGVEYWSLRFATIKIEQHLSLRLQLKLHWNYHLFPEIDRTKKHLPIEISFRFVKTVRIRYLLHVRWDLVYLAHCVRYFLIHWQKDALLYLFHNLSNACFQKSISFELL